MPEKRKNERRGWNLLLAAHLLVYVIAWCLAIYAQSILNVVDYNAAHTQFVGAVLLWLPVLALHVVAYVSSDRRNAAPDAERQAYRDGFTDAMERFVDRPYDEQRLELRDEGELIELPEKRKRREV